MQHTRSAGVNIHDLEFGNEIEHQKHKQQKTGKFTNMWKFNTTLMMSQCVKEEVKREIREYLDSGKVDTRHQNL